MVLVVKNPLASAGDRRDVGSVPGSGRSPGGGNGQTTPVFLPRKSHGERSLVGHSPWGRKESDPAGATEHSRPSQEANPGSQLGAV